MRRFALLLLPAAALSACVENDGHYPSLLPRAIESQGIEEPVRPEPVVAADASIDAEVAKAVAGLDKAKTDFATAAQDAEAKVAVARGLPEGSEPWLDAQTALARLASKRAPVLNALESLEAIAIARGKTGLPPYPAVDQAVAGASALSNEQAARIATLEASLATP